MSAETYEELIEWFCNMPQAFRRQNPIRAEAMKVGVNDPCPCGSGKKFKKCCRR